MSGARPKEYRQGRPSSSNRTRHRSSSGSRSGRRNRGTDVGEKQSAYDNQMVTYVIQLLCIHGGQAKVSDLENYTQQLQQQQQQQQPPSLLTVMSKSPQQFTLFRLRDDDVLAKVRTDLKLCAKYCTGAGCNSTPCDALHICKYFLISSCSAEKKQVECDYGHDFGTYYNSVLLQRHGLGGLHPRDLQLIFKLNRSQATLPMTCKFYNGKAGCNKAGGKGCPGMHICQPFLENRCKFGEECQCSHNLLDIQPKNIMLQYGFNVQRRPDVILQELRGQMQNGPPGRSRHGSQEQGYARSNPLSPAAPSAVPVSPNSYVKPTKMAATLGSAPPGDDNGELKICMFFLRGKCFYGDRCHNKHSRRPFQWQREQSNMGQVTWVDLNAKENLELELNFSDPNKEECFLGDPARVLKVDFVKMVFFEGGGQAVKVRRLGTISSVLAPPTHKGTTRWLWFWRDDAQKWIEYGDPDTNEGFEAGVTSADLEEIFHQNKSSKVQFETSGYRYELDFATMTQVNLSLGTKRPVHRRPVFDKETDYTTQSSSPKDIVALLKDLKLRLEEARPHKTSETIPPHWDFEHASDNDYFHAVPVLMSGSTLGEYINIKKLFHRTVPGKTIKSIKRIQNFDLWEKFERKKLKMERKLKGGETLDERRLFHGTSRKCMDAICQQGFDWRYSGTSTGALYGDGSYFARDAKYSSCYTEDSTMFVARVLVGQFAQGSSGERLPPVKDPRRQYGERYDSSVDDPSDPSIFVIYQDDQSYPEYLIEY